MSPEQFFLGWVYWVLIIILLGFFADFWIIIEHKSSNSALALPDAAFNYYRRPKYIPKDAFLLDTHSHTLASDGIMTAEQNIRWHIANGFNAFVVSDHNSDLNNKPSLALQNKYPEIMIIPGYEWTRPLIHMNFINLEKYPFSVPNNPNKDDIKKIIPLVQQMGALVQVDHIPWTKGLREHLSGELVHPTREELIEWGVDGFEINNENRYYDPTTIRTIELMEKKGELEKKLFFTSGTDIHNPANAWVTGWTEVLLTPQEKKAPTIEIVIKALREGRTKLWLDYDEYIPYERAFLKKEGKMKSILKPIYNFGTHIYHEPYSRTLLNLIKLSFLYVPLALFFILIF
jgi:hypothetical protein